MTPNAGRVAAISRSVSKGTPKANVSEVRLIADWGLEGDAHAGEGHRQVSLLAIESIRKMAEKGVVVPPGGFAENITTEQVDLMSLMPGDRLAVGEAELEITQLGKVCHERCAIYEQAGDCVMPREGVFARVVRGGRARVGDPVRFASSSVSEPQSHR